MAHIFISYSHEDQRTVERLRSDLHDAGLVVWIDDIGLQPGTPDWDDAIREAISSASAVLLIASPISRRRPVVRDEIALALDAGKPVYPVWIAGEKWLESVPLGLGSTQYVDLRGSAYAAGLARLIRVLSGGDSDTRPVEPAASRTLDTLLAEPRNPYKGLRAFQAGDRGDFFGRETLVEDLLGALGDGLRAPRLLGLLGASGSGKSSVMLAGVLPRLQDGALPGSEKWVYLDPMLPGAQPLEQLTIRLARRLGRSHGEIRHDLLDASKRGLHRLASEIGAPVVLYIDQFEELFTLTEQESERRHFIDLLAAAVSAADGVLLVLLSMRADFYDRPLQYPTFGKLLETHHAAVTPMTLADLYDVVQQPARLPDVALKFDEGLVTELVFAVRQEASALPLMQFTLDQLFQRREGQRLTRAAYDTLGGVKGALAQHAETTYEHLPAAQHQALARSLFLRLIEPGQTEQDTTRRRATYEQLTLPDAQMTRLLNETAAAFVAARLLVSDQSGPERTLEVSHEALIREWARLREWLHDAREDLRLQKALTADVAEWKRRGQPNDMLYRGTVLAEARQWALRSAASRDETMFLHESQRAEAARTAREAAAQRRVRLLAASLGVVLVAASVGLALIFGIRNTALSDEVATLQFEGGYVQAQVGWLSTRIPSLGGFPPQLQLTATPARDFLATATAQAALAAGWQPLQQDFNCDEGGCVAMVQVPPGCFWMGSQFDFTESPAHEICFSDPFWIDAYEVSNAQFERLGGEAAAPPDWEEANQPRTAVTWFEARAFCDRRGARLPTEAEWEYAARGPDSLAYPWGMTWEPGRANWDDGGNGANDGSTGAAPVETYPDGQSWVGAYNLSGNVWEWVSSRSMPYPYVKDDGRENDDEADQRVIRGGSLYILPIYLRGANREATFPGIVNDQNGFRCARPFQG